MEGELYNVQEGLEGELGYKGERGYSAYDIAVLHGFEGSEQDWIDHFGLDLSDYIKTTDVVDNLTSTSTNYPLSANQGKELKNLVDTNTTVINTKADANNTYTKDEIDSLLEKINGKVLWVNQNPSSDFTTQLVQLDLSNYDLIDIYFTDGHKLSIPSYYKDNSKYYSFSNGLIHGGGTTDYSTTYNFTGRIIKWANNGIWFHIGYIGSIDDYNGSIRASYEQWDGALVPYYIIGKKTNYFN